MDRGLCFFYRLFAWEYAGKILVAHAEARRSACSARDIHRVDLPSGMHAPDGKPGQHSQIPVRKVRVHFVLNGIEDAAVAGHDDLAAGDLLDGGLQNLLLVLVALHISVCKGFTFPGEVQCRFALQVVPAFLIVAVVDRGIEFILGIHIDPSDGVDQIHQHGEVDCDSVVDIDVQEILDGLLCLFFPIDACVGQFILLPIGVERHITVSRNGC